MADVIFTVEGAVALITINRPQALNALNKNTIVELEQIIARISTDSSLRSVIITGAGEKAFIAGADIKEMLALTPEEAGLLSQKGQGLFSNIENMPQVTIAAINGFALGGGCELAMACDIRLASVKAKFGQPEINLGIIPGYAGTQRLPRLIGLGRAKEMIFSGEMIDAEEAYRIGLVNRLYPLEELLIKAREAAEKFTSKSPGAIKYAKSALHKSLNMDLVSGCSFETLTFSLCFANDAQREGMSAFLEKRKV